MLRERADMLYNKIALAEGLCSSRERTLADMVTNIERMEEDLSVVGKAEIVLGDIATQVLTASTKPIDDLVITGIRSVFADKNLHFETKVSKFKGKTSLQFILYEEGEPAPLMESYGGGVIVLIGLLLRVILITLLDLRRVLILDEPLAQISEQYIPDTSKLLRKLASDLDFKILMVTHQVAFAEEADKHYVATKEKGHVLSTIFTEKT